MLPQLYGVQVIEQPGTLPYILVSADTSTTWSAVKKYWENNGIRLRTQEPAICLMETDWLENQSDLPRTGFSGLLDNLIKLTHDSGTRDRYRVRFSREGDKTGVSIVYSQAEEKAVRDLNSKDPQGFRWSQTDNDNPELQLEMTRRIALFVSAELRRQHEVSQQHAGEGDLTGGAVNGVRAQLTTAGGRRRSPSRATTARHGAYSASASTRRASPSKNRTTKAAPTRCNTCRRAPKKSKKPASGRACGATKNPKTRTTHRATSSALRPGQPQHRRRANPGRQGRERQRSPRLARNRTERAVTRRITHTHRVRSGAPSL